MKVVVVSGGFSTEQHASRDSAKSISDALKTLGHVPFIVEYNENFTSEIKKISPDVVFPIVQGKFHGDGAVQAVLELLGIPYVGSRPHAAAIINHKTICKKIWHSAGICTPEFFEYGYKEYMNGGFSAFIKKAESVGLTLPIVVKAPTQGSRYGMVFVKDEDSFDEIKSVFQYDEVLLSERYVEGRFITQGLIEINGEMSILPPVEIIDDTGSEFKRFYGVRLPYCNPDFTESELVNINETTRKAAELVDASSFVRLDYHISKGELFLLEINAVPGLRRHYSDLFKCAKAAGYDYETLIAMILATAK